MLNDTWLQTLFNLTIYLALLKFFSCKYIYGVLKTSYIPVVIFEKQGGK